MQEALLQFIWQYSLYRPQGLLTSLGEAITVVHPGTINTNAGPDFSEARIRIGETLLVGNIELHPKTSDWRKHGHQNDANYDNIILHVVFIDDLPVDKEAPSVLELGPHIPADVIERYTNLLQTPNTIPCKGQLNKVSSLTKESWLNRMLVARWERKLEEWQGQLQQANGDWRTLLYWRLAANMGFRINAEPFLQTAMSIPLTVWGRHHSNLMQLEALLFGQAGLLQKDFKDEYPIQLKAEYAFLQKKYNLKPIAAYLWKFMRMRPANFPTIRLAQFAALLHKSGDIFTLLLTDTDKTITTLHNLHASTYWDTHYQLDGNESKHSVKNLGSSSVEKLIINTIAPIRFLSAHAQGKMDEAEQAVNWLSELPAEENKILSLWEEAGWPIQNAADGQAQLELFHSYCSAKRCLECSIGLSLIRSGPQKR